jgi:hypothetical protein
MIYRTARFPPREFSMRSVAGSSPSMRWASGSTAATSKGGCAIAPAAAAAFERLAAGDIGGYRAILGPTVALSRRLFEAPTLFYKPGVVFLAWLMVIRITFICQGEWRLADQAGLFAGPDRAVLAHASLLGDMRLMGRGELSYCCIWYYNRRYVKDDRSECPSRRYRGHHLRLRWDLG